MVDNDDIEQEIANIFNKADARRAANDHLKPPQKETEQPSVYISIGGDSKGNNTINVNSSLSSDAVKKNRK